MTNPIFEDKTDLWDVRWSFLAGKEDKKEKEKKKEGTLKFSGKGNIKPSQSDKVHFFFFFSLFHFFFLYLFLNSKKIDFLQMCNGRN